MRNLSIIQSIFNNVTHLYLSHNNLCEFPVARKYALFNHIDISYNNILFLTPHLKMANDLKYINLDENKKLILSENIFMQIIKSTDKTITINEITYSENDISYLKIIYNRIELQFLAPAFALAPAPAPAPLKFQDTIFFIHDELNEILGSKIFFLLIDYVSTQKFTDKEILDTRTEIMNQLNSMQTGGTKKYKKIQKLRKRTYKKY